MIEVVIALNKISRPELTEIVLVTIGLRVFCRNTPIRLI